MATHDRRESTPIAGRLTELASGYNFYQAVRLLAPARDRELTLLESIDRAIKFDTEAGGQFAGSDIYAMSDAQQPDSQHTGAQQQALITLATFGLTGHLGPLPQQHSDRIEAQARDGQDALKKFLGLFEHRLISLLYLVKQKNCLGLHNGRRAHSAQYQYLIKMSGLPHSPNNKVEPKYECLLPFSGLLAGGKMSTPALTNMLSTLLNTDVKVRPFGGAFVSLDPSSQAKLSAHRRPITPHSARHSVNGPVNGQPMMSSPQANAKPQVDKQRLGSKQRLGDKVALGTRIWNQSHGITLNVGPVDWRTANQWVPGRSEYAQLVDTLLYTTNGQWHLDLSISVLEETIPLSQFNNEMRLGVSSWLKTHQDLSDDTAERSLKVTRRSIKPNHFH